MGLIEDLFKKYGYFRIPCTLNGNDFSLNFWQMATILHAGEGHPHFGLASEFERVYGKKDFDFGSDLSTSIKDTDKTQNIQQLTTSFVCGYIPDLTNDNANNYSSEIFDIDFRNHPIVQNIAERAANLLWNFNETMHNKKGKTHNGKVTTVSRITPSMITSQVSTSDLQENLECFQKEAANANLDGVHYSKSEVMNLLNTDRAKRKLEPYKCNSPDWITFWTEMKKRQNEFQITVKKYKGAEIVYFQPAQVKKKQQNLGNHLTEIENLLKDPPTGFPKLSTLDEVFDYQFEVLPIEELCKDRMTPKDFEKEFKRINAITLLKDPMKSEFMKLRQKKGVTLCGRANKELNIRARHQFVYPELLEHRSLLKKVFFELQGKVTPTENKEQRTQEKERPKEKPEASSLVPFQIWWWDCLTIMHHNVPDGQIILLTVLCDIMKAGVPDPLKDIDVDELDSKLKEEDFYAIQTFVGWMLTPIVTSFPYAWEHLSPLKGSKKLLWFARNVKVTERWWSLQSTDLWLIAGFAFHHMDMFQDLKRLELHFDGLPSFKHFPTVYRQMGENVNPEPYKELSKEKLASLRQPMEMTERPIPSDMELTEKVKNCPGDLQREIQRDRVKKREPTLWKGKPQEFAVPTSVENTSQMSELQSMVIEDNPELPITQPEANSKKRKKTED